MISSLGCLPFTGTTRCSDWAISMPKCLEVRPELACLNVVTLRNERDFRIDMYQNAHERHAQRRRQVHRVVSGCGGNYPAVGVVYLRSFEHETTVTWHPDRDAATVALPADSATAARPADSATAARPADSATAARPADSATAARPADSATATRPLFPADPQSQSPMSPKLGRPRHPNSAAGQTRCARRTGRTLAPSWRRRTRPPQVLPIDIWQQKLSS
jgi:hypothetical protein